uniref:Protein kinase domain-containing protein n=1 Tax=Panagrolaimus sp. JU765 TaxID=591449 RepID=A0AC34Q969_9BILA
MFSETTKKRYLPEIDQRIQKKISKSSDISNVHVPRDPQYYNFFVDYELNQKTLPMISYKFLSPILSTKEDLIIFGHVVPMKDILKKKKIMSRTIWHHLKNRGSLKINGITFEIIANLSEYEVQAKVKTLEDNFYIRTEVKTLEDNFYIRTELIRHDPENAHILNYSSIKNVERFYYYVKKNPDPSVTKCFMKAYFSKKLKRKYLIQPYHCSLSYLITQCQRSFSKQSAFYLGYQTFKAIHDVHLHYHVHRNIKPASFFINCQDDKWEILIGNLSMVLDYTKKDEE